MNTQTFLRNYPIPTNGLVFVEDHVWVEGQINTARVTIASGKFPDNSSTRTSITVNNDLLYTNYDGQDVIALIAQNNFNVGLVSEDDLRIDAALMAQNGRVGRYYYSSSCAISGTQYWKRLTLTLYGMIGTYQRYGFCIYWNNIYLPGWNTESKRLLCAQYQLRCKFAVRSTAKFPAHIRRVYNAHLGRRIKEEVSSNELACLPRRIDLWRRQVGSE